MTRWKLVLYLEARPIPCVHRCLLPFSGGCAAANLHRKTRSGTRFKDRRSMDWEQTHVDGLPEFRLTLLKSKGKRNYRQLWTISGHRQSRLPVPNGKRYFPVFWCQHEEELAVAAR
jgi:hypothetical protein